MRVLFGIILGAALTIGGAFISDSWSSGPGAAPTPNPGPSSSTTTLPHRNMVNWDVVSDNMRSASRRAREAWSALSQKVQS